MRNLSLSSNALILGFTVVSSSPPGLYGSPDTPRILTLVFVIGYPSFVASITVIKLTWEPESNNTCAFIFLPHTSLIISNAVDNIATFFLLL